MEQCIAVQPKAVQGMLRMGRLIVDGYFQAFDGLVDDRQHRRRMPGHRERRRHHILKQFACVLSVSGGRHHLLRVQRRRHRDATAFLAVGARSPPNAAIELEDLSMKKRLMGVVEHQAVTGLPDRCLGDIGDTNIPVTFAFEQNRDGSLVGIMRCRQDGQGLLEFSI